MSVKYPEVNVQLVGEDGNAFAILGRVVKAMKRAGISEGVREQFVQEAKGGDYNNLLQVVMAWVAVDEDDEDECWESAY